MSDVEDIKDDTTATEQKSEPLDLKLIEDIVKENEEQVELSSLRIFSFEELMPVLTKLTKTTALGIRKNLLHDITLLPVNLHTLTELDLYDNKIRHIVNLEVLAPTLKKLDLSYNQIKEVTGLDSLVNLEELYLVENKIKRLQGFNALRNLKLLELGGNNIREIPSDAFTGLVSLEQLFLGKNKIAQLGDGLGCLGNLQRLSLQANRLTFVGEGLANNHALTELYLSENGISVIEGVQHLAKLKLLDYSFNPVVSISPLCGMKDLTVLNEFWLTDGKVADWAEVASLSVFPNLETVYLERNPIEQDKRYRNKVFHALPQLRQIDSWPIVNRQNPEADRSRDRGFKGTGDD